MSRIGRLGLGIVAFEGTEHLKNVTYELRGLCDVILVCLQRLSYHGEPIADEDVARVEDLERHGYVDGIVWFEPASDHADRGAQAPRYVEADKRNFILDRLRDEGCTQAIVTDSDEFYDAEDFAAAKAVYDATDEMRVSYCEYVNYYRDYEHILVWTSRTYVPFIADTAYGFDMDRGRIGLPSDPTRRYYIPEGDDAKRFVFNYDVVKMHHLSWIRKDISKKMRSWSAKLLFSDNPNLAEEALERYRTFRDGQDAIITTTVPYFRMMVRRLPKQYIHPHYGLDQALEPGVWRKGGAERP